MFKLITTAALLSAPILAAPAAAQSADIAGTATATTLVQQDKKDADRPALKHYDLGKKSLALGGYDPVAYFPEHGGKAKKGSKKITTKHRGVLYRFSSEANKKTFLANPAKFEPAYGGWCAWAMADGKGSKTEADPESFTIEDGRLYVFYDGFWGDTRKSWRKGGGAPKLASKSDKNWKRISGESKPVVKEAPEKKDPAKKDAKKGSGKQNG